MAKKQNTNWIWLIAVIGGLLLLWYGGTHNWFKSSLTITPTTTIIERLENPTPTPSGVTCSLSLSRSVMTAGELVSGTITDGKNAYCEGFGKMIGTTEWRKISEGTTDITGRTTYSENFWVVGDFVFAAICDSNGNGFLDAQDCVTNQVSLRVNPAPESPKCVDSDGNDIFTFGWVDDTEAMVSYPDKCYDSNSVIEYVCNPMPSAMMPQNCPTTHKCEGGRCVLKTGYSEGDVITTYGGSGILEGTDGKSWDLDLLKYDIELGGDCHLGAKIYRSWNYAVPGCEGSVGTVDWTFFDSSGYRWGVYDTSPITTTVDVCPANWDGKTNWYFEVVNTKSPNCPINYNVEIKIYVCEC